MAVFRRCQIVLDLTTSVKFKDKSQLRKDITSNGGIVSFIVTKKSTHVVCNDPEKADISYKCQMAAKFGLPIVSIQWINQCVEKGTLLDTDDFLVVGKSRSERLKEGKISATRFQKKEKKKTVKPFINVNKFKVWTPDDNDCPLFSPDIQLAKYAVLIDEKRYKKNQTFTVLEVHVDEQFSAGDSVYEYKYRVVSHSGSVCLVERGDPGCFEYRFCSNIDEVLTVYSFLYKQEQQHGMTLMHNNFPQNIGSEKFRMVVGELGVECGTMVEEVEDLVELIWHEALGELESILSVPVSNIKMEQIEKAEAVLKQIKSAVDCEDTSKIAQLMADFYKELPLEKRDVGDDSLNMKAWISRKNDTCQLVKDMISVCEATNWSLRSSTESKYRALRCVIDCLSKSSCEYDRVEQHIKSSLSDYEDSSFKVQAIYAVNRPLENVNFMSELPNRQELFHASKVDNIVGILSRGLLMPKVVVDDHGGVRSDPGMLGSGIYFASSASTSVQYSTPSKMKGSRFMLVCEVALGNTKEMYMKDLSLTSPPEGYQSVHGMKCTDCVKSEFKNDEFVVYETAQQRIKYLVEFTTYSDVIKDVDLGVNIDNQDDIDDDDIELLNLTDVKDIVDPMSKVKAGLVSKDDAPVHLKCVHIRAKLMDLASEVVVLQEYQNNSESPLEAKYVCPLSDMAAVCGFEAFINGKHIVGEVKEKETAHKEYKKAISEGHGAYLMDQDEETPDVFTVSVGNLPSGACVLIKITYVTELQAEGDMISFRLPGSVAPWKKDSLKEETQIVTDTYEVKQGETSVQVSIDMPFDIRSIECPTHKIKSKRTLSKATVEMLPNQSITDGFQLYIGLAEIHVPRMWVERKPGDTDHQACMLTFYPQFEACESDDVGVILMLDLSNSMKGDNLISAKKILLLTLQKLPPSFNFNIVVFGTAWLELFPTCTKNTTANRKLASEFVQSVSASMGNTEMVHPMHSLYLLKPDSFVQNVFIISDGHLNNPDFMLKSARENSQHTRIFTFGISSTANRHLLRTLARAAAGAFEFFDSKAKSKWEGKVKSQIHRAAQPGLTSVKVDWEQHGDDVASPVQAPSQITALFNGSRSVIYGYVPNCTMATLTAHIGSDEVSTMVSTSDVSITEGLILHRLTAKAIITDWEDGVLSPDRTDHEILKMNTKNFIIELSKEYSIVTQFTSFVAIEKRDEDEEQYAVDAPTMGELIELENVDQLQYMEYKEDEVIQLHEPLPDYEEDEEMDELYECFDGVDDDVIEESYMSAPQEICDGDISLLGMSMEEKPEEVKVLVEENEHFRKFSRSALKSTRKQGPPSGGWQQETADSSMGGGISPVTKSPVQLLEIQSADMCLAEAKMFEPMAETEMMIATPLMADEALTQNWEEKNYEAVESFSAKSLENSVSPKFVHHEESSDDDMAFSLFDDDAVSDSSEAMEEEGKKGKRAPTSRRGISVTAPARPDPFIVTGEKTDKMKKPTSERLGKKVDVSPPPRLALAAAPQLKALMHHQLEGQQQQQSLELSHQKRQSAIAESISSMIPRRGRRRGKMDSRQTILQFPDSAPSKQPFMQTKSHLRSSAFSPTSPAYSPTSPGYSPTSPSYSPSTPQLDQEIYSVSLCSAQLPPQAPPPPPPPHQPPIRTYSAYQADGYSGARFYSCISPPHQEPPIRGGKPQPGGALFGSRPPPPEPSQSSFGGVSHIDLLSTEPQPLSRSPISFSFGGKRSKNVPLQLSAFDSAEARYSYTPSAPPLPPQTISAPPPPPPPPSDLAPPPPPPSNLAPSPLSFGSSAPPPKMIPTHPPTDLLQHSAPTILAKRKKKSVVLKEKETAECFDKQSATLVSWRTEGSKEVSKPKAEVLLDETDLCMYGIGVNIPSILKTSVMELKDVSTVINMQNNFGTWVMDSKLQDLLCVNFDVCKTVLNKAGLRSLGIKCYDEIIEMISTTVVLLCIVKCVIPDIFPINFRLDGAVQYLLTKLNDMLESKKRSKHMPPQSNVMATFSSAMHFCEKIDLMYPLVCSQLELGQHWTEFVGKMLQLHSTEGGNTFDLDSAGTCVSKDAPLVQNVNALECSLLI